MGVNLVIALGLLSLLFALYLTATGIQVLLRHRRAAPAVMPVTVTLEQKGTFTPEPGVLLNTLWEHLPNAACQSGECGGCKLRLLEGEVEWIREPVVEVNRSTHILACSCTPISPIRCALEE
jgi:ferredoxin